jgi:hypothetical protein
MTVQKEESEVFYAEFAVFTPPPYFSCFLQSVSPYRNSQYTSMLLAAMRRFIPDSGAVTGP